MKEIIKDKRLRQRVSFSLNKIAGNSDSSLPTIFPENKDLVGFYRLIHNPKISLSDWNELVKKESIEKSKSSKKEDCLLALHDSTQIKALQSFLEKPKGGRPDLFLSHMSLAVSLDKEPEVYGLVGTHFWKGASFTTQPERWLEQAQATNDVAKKVIHVMDREADKMSLLEVFSKEGMSFVIRNKSDRKLSDYDKKLKELLSEQDFCKTVVKAEISKRTGGPFASNRKINPSREARKASLSFQALENVKFPGVDKNSGESVELNYVRVVERFPPKGEKPIEWILATSEKVSTEEEVLNVVSIYRKRWIIEEFFKALKTGCKVEEKQFESPESWEKFIVLLSSVAVRILNLRAMERQSKAMPLDSILSKEEIAMAKVMGKKLKVVVRSAKGFLKLIASMGGHNPRNGPVGWQILLRGFQKFELMTQGAQAFQEMC